MLFKKVFYYSYLYIFLFLGYFVYIIKQIDNKAVVMTIGDGFNDNLMMELSDIAIEVK